MTENSHIDGYHEEAEFEREDLAPKSIFTFFVGLAVVCVLGFLTLNGMYRYWTRTSTITSRRKIHWCSNPGRIHGV